MTEPARQSYYEIALTNRQVLSVFVVLLVSVLTAFMAGVWVGRRATEGPVETGEAETITAGVEPTDEPLESFDFFSRDQGAEGESAAAEPPARAEPPAAAEPPPAAPRTADAALAEPAGGTDAGAAPEPTPEPEDPATSEPEEEAAPATAAAPAPTTPAPAAASAAGSLVVQVFSSQNQVQAQSVVDRLRAGGFPAILSPVEVSGRTMYRVRVGPYEDRAEAEGVAEQVRREYRLETWITE